METILRGLKIFSVLVMIGLFSLMVLLTIGLCLNIGFWGIIVTLPGWTLALCLAADGLAEWKNI